MACCSCGVTLPLTVQEHVEEFMAKHSMGLSGSISDTLFLHKKPSPAKET